MPRNNYLNPKVRTEQMMYEDIIIEALRMYGQEVYYLPREWQTDPTSDVFGDDPVSRFSDSFELMMYIENIEGFDGEGDLFTRFGIELRDEATFVLARREWDKRVGMKNSDVSFYRPREGDLIYLKLSNSLFEIQKVETESPFYQFAQLPTFKIRASLFESNGEDFDTMLPDLNSDVENTEAYRVQLTLTFDSAATSTFYTGEIVETIIDSDAGDYLRGEVLDWDGDASILTLTHVGKTTGDYGMWVANNLVEGSVSGAVGTVTEVYEVVDGSTNTAQNDLFDSTSFIDFSERNPFGEP